jgi:excinuclease ABC subunit C
VVVDGGKGQLSVAFATLTQLNLENKITLIGLAERLEEIYFVGDGVPLFLDKNSESLKLLMRLRDEAHRFGITHHRQKRSTALIVTQLTAIEGIGEKTAEKLLRHFHRVSRIKAATLEEISNVTGKKAAERVKQFLTSTTSLHCDREE